MNNTFLQLFTIFFSFWLTWEQIFQNATPTNHIQIFSWIFLPVVLKKYFGDFWSFEFPICNIVVNGNENLLKCYLLLSSRSPRSLDLLFYFRLNNYLQRHICCANIQGFSFLLRDQAGSFPWRPNQALCYLRSQMLTISLFPLEWTQTR